MEPKKELVIKAFGFDGYANILRLAKVLGANLPRITENLGGAWVYGRKVNFKEACTVVDIANARRLSVEIYLDDKRVKTISDVKAIFYGFPLEEVSG